MAESQIKIRVLSSLMNDMKNGIINVNHPLQRHSGQWNKKQMCRLIYCLILDKPMPTLLFSKKHNNALTFVIDGKQRLTNIYSYINNEYKLNSGFEPVEIYGVEYEVSGKYFKELDPIIQERLESKEIITQIMIDPTDKDERESFADFNSTPSLTKTQLRKVDEGHNLMELLEKLKSHPFVKKVLTDKQLLKDFDNELMLQLIMITELANNPELISFSDNAMSKFVRSYNESIDYDKIDVIIQALDEFDNAFKFPIKVKKTSLPMVLYGMYYTIVVGKSTASYIEWLKGFLSTYDTNLDPEYAKYTKDGTSSGKAVQGRLDYFKRAIDNL